MAVPDWVSELRLREPTAAGEQVLRAIESQPERASYATAAGIAAIAGVEASNVTRIAQSLGFAGWPALREELRARYLQTLSLVEIATRHGEDEPASPRRRSMNADRRALDLLDLDPETSASIVELLAAAPTRLAIGGGSFAAVAQIFASNCTLAGYPTTYLSEAGAVANALARLTEGDVLVVFDFWRLYRGMARATEAARARGAAVVVVSDHPRTALTRPATHVVTVPSEGGAYFPTMVPAIVVANALCAELAGVDPTRTEESIRRAERIWTEMDVMG